MSDFIGKINAMIILQSLYFMEPIGFALDFFRQPTINGSTNVSGILRNLQLGECELGILVCGTGIGMSIAANKHKGIRAACCSDTYSAKMTRQHNDANVLCMGARVIGSCLAIDILDAFLANPFEGGRHALRVDMMMELEK